MNDYNNIPYQTITGASITGEALQVEFANGNSIKIALPQVVNVGEAFSTEGFKITIVSFNSNEVIISDNGTELTVPWDKIRVLTDKGFSKEMSKKAEEQAAKIGIKIKRLRELQSMKSNDLADRSGISAQTISRIEKGHQDVSFITLRKLLAAMGYSLQDLAQEDARLIASEEKKTFSLLLKRVSRAGIDPNFLIKRIIPKVLQGQLLDLQNSVPELLIDEATSYISQIYGWSLGEIWGNKVLEVENKYIRAPLYKKVISANQNLIKAYLPYAKFLADATIKAANKDKVNSFPETINEFREILSGFGGLTLEALIKYCWSMGIYVIPLNDAGTFHGAAWRIDLKNVIILKQKNQSHAKWMFDLLHEMFHVFNHLKEETELVLELGDINPYILNTDQELEANSFANEILLNGIAEDYVREVVDQTSGKVERLKSVVKEVAKKYNLRADSLANYLAYRLDSQGTDWWGASDALQQKEPEAFEVAKEIFLENISMNKLNTVEKNLLNTAFDINTLNHEI